MDEKRVSKTAAIAAVAALALASHAFAATESRLCVGPACLGMGVDEVAALPLEPAGTFKFAFAKGLGQTFGLDAKGERVWFVTGDFDRNTASQFAQKVKTICAAEFVSARLKASDGQLIRLTLRPVIEGGRARLAVTEIARSLPANLSPSDLESFKSQAAERYGDAYSREWRTVVSKPSASVHFDVGTGHALKLRLPFEIVRGQMLEQPGCSSRPSLD